MDPHSAAVPRRLRLRDVRLAGGLRVLNCVLFGLTMMAVAVMAATYFMDWHALHGDALFSGGILGPLEGYDSGYSHSGDAPLLLLAIIAVMSSLSLLRPRFGLGIGASITNVALWLLLVALLFNLDHLFEHVTSLAPEAIFIVAMLMLALVGLVNVVVQPVMWVILRRRIAKREACAAYATSGNEFALNARVAS